MALRRATTRGLWLRAIELGVMSMFLNIKQLDALVLAPLLFMLSFGMNRSGARTSGSVLAELRCEAQRYAKES